MDCFFNCSCLPHLRSGRTRAASQEAHRERAVCLLFVRVGGVTAQSQCLVSITVRPTARCVRRAARRVFLGSARGARGRKARPPSRLGPGCLKRETSSAPLHRSPADVWTIGPPCCLGRDGGRGVGRGAPDAVRWRHASGSERLRRQATPGWGSAGQ